MWGAIPGMIVRDGVRTVATDAILPAAITSRVIITSSESDDINTISSLL